MAKSKVDKTEGGEQANGRIVTLNQKDRRVKIAAFELENELVFGFFDKLPEGERDALLRKALHIGAVALMEERISAFLARTQNELGTELESLKILFDWEQKHFEASTQKGALAEKLVARFLNDYFKDAGWADQAVETGAETGQIAKNKTGDVLCSVEGSERTIAIEVKFDKSLKLGDIGDKDVFIKKADTAWSQILEAKANRDSEVGVIVFDERVVDVGIRRAIGGGVGFLRGVGFVAIVDSRTNDYRNLALAYALARDIVLHAKSFHTDDEALTILVQRVVKDLQALTSMRKHVDSITKSAGALMDDLDKSTLSMQFSLEYLQRFLQQGTLTKEDLFAFYAAEPVKERFKALQLERP